MADAVGRLTHGLGQVDRGARHGLEHGDRPALEQAGQDFDIKRAVVVGRVGHEAGHGQAVQFRARHAEQIECFAGNEQGECRIEPALTGAVEHLAIFASTDESRPR